MFALKRMIHKIKHRNKPILTKQIVSSPIHYYELSPTCQIPKLEIFYIQYFGRRNCGCFVEVGAYDGEYVSNTSGLADIGWAGYYIEPVPEYFQKCKERHAKNKNVTVSHCAIGASSAEIEINVGGPLSTIRDDVKKNFEHLDWARSSFVGRMVKVAQLTLDEYLLEQRIKPHFDLLIVDVEGYEWNVFRKFDIKKWNPQMVIVELHDQNPNYLLIRDECNKLVCYFEDNNYKIIYKDLCNTIYVQKDSFPDIEKI